MNGEEINGEMFQNVVSAFEAGVALANLIVIIYFITIFVFILSLLLALNVSYVLVKIDLAISLYVLTSFFWVWYSAINTLYWKGVKLLKSTVTSCEEDCFAIYKSVLLPINVISTVSGNPAIT